MLKLINYEETLKHEIPDELLWLPHKKLNFGKVDCGVTVQISGHSWK